MNTEELFKNLTGSRLSVQPDCTGAQLDTNIPKDFGYQTTNSDDAHSSPYSPLCLAYLGDSVFELLVRTEIVSKYDAHVDELNKRATGFVKARAQADMYHRLYETLTEEEKGVIKRGRNAKSYTKAKNATVSDYRHATGLEALFGYLYLQKRTERIMELFQKCMEVSE